MQHRPIYLLALALAGCATQRDPATVSNFEICRYTMHGGNNAVVAENEARRRGLDCRAYYPAIAAQEQAANDATANFLRAITPPPRPAPTRCTTIYNGGIASTRCY